MLLAWFNRNSLCKRYWIRNARYRISIPLCLRRQLHMHLLFFKCIQYWTILPIHFIKPPLHRLQIDTPILSRWWEVSSRSLLTLVLFDVIRAYLFNEWSENSGKTELTNLTTINWKTGPSLSSPTKSSDCGLLHGIWRLVPIWCKIRIWWKMTFEEKWWKYPLQQFTMEPEPKKRLHLTQHQPTTQIFIRFWIFLSIEKSMTVWTRPSLILNGVGFLLTVDSLLSTNLTNLFQQKVVFHTLH